MKDYKMNIRRGDIFYANLSPTIGSEQGGIRPVLILQNNIDNRYSPTVIVCAITGKTEKNNIPTHVFGQYGLRMPKRIMYSVRANSHP